MGKKERHFGVTVTMKAPTFWEWLTCVKRVAKFILVYELNGSSSTVALKGAETVHVRGPHDQA